MRGRFASGKAKLAEHNGNIWSRALTKHGANLTAKIVFFLLGSSVILEGCCIEVLHDIWNGFDFDYMLSILLGLIPTLLCITLHELSHGYAAYLLGDDTAKRMGRLTLNPLKHLDPVGFLMMLLYHVGWAKPVPVDPNRFREPRRDMALTAFAGPACNILITVVFLFLFGAAIRPLSGSAAGEYLLQMLQMTGRLSLGMAVFNLMPIPPLDGSKILQLALDDESYVKMLRLEPYSGLLLFVLMGRGVLDAPLGNLIRLLYNSLFPVAEGAYRLVSILFYR